VWQPVTFVNKTVPGLQKATAERFDTLLQKVEQNENVGN